MLALPPMRLATLATPAAQPPVHRAFFCALADAKSAQPDRTLLHCGHHAQEHHPLPEACPGVCRHRLLCQGAAIPDLQRRLVGRVLRLSILPEIASCGSARRLNAGKALGTEYRDGLAQLLYLSLQRARCCCCLFYQRSILLRDIVHLSNRIIDLLKLVALFM